MRIRFIAAVLAGAVCAAPMSASAYDVVNLPDTMTLSEALEIYSVTDIASATVSEISQDKHIELSQEEIKDFYYSAQEVKLERRINPTPFRGISLNLHLNDGSVKSFNLTSGVQIGKYGNSNYVCYTMNSIDMSDYMYLDSMYHESEEKYPGADYAPALGMDFLKLPEDPWAVNPVAEAASRSLLPYEFTSNYGAYISREDFCGLLGNFIAVTGGYSSIESYMKYNGLTYDDGAFADCVGRDPSICILHALGIVNGKSGVMFEPEACLTREEAAKMLTETASLFRNIYSQYKLTYSDRSQISSWAQFYVKWVSDKGVMGGMDSERFAPKDYYTRQQAIATVTRLFNVCG